MSRRSRLLMILRRSLSMEQQIASGFFQNRRSNDIFDSNDSTTDDMPATPSERNTEQDTGALEVNDNLNETQEQDSSDDEISSPDERIRSTTTLNRMSQLSNINGTSSSSSSTTNFDSPRQAQHLNDLQYTLNAVSGSQLGFVPYTAHAALEARLSTIVRCIICQLAPLTPFLQCTHAHLICAGCYQVCITDRSLGVNMAKCPLCLVRIYRKTAVRNRVAEAANEQLPVLCAYCLVLYVRRDLQKHQRYVCANRPRKCRFRRVGCPWQGPHYELRFHESNCPTANMSGAEVFEFMQERDKRMREERQVLNGIVTLLQSSHLTFRMFQHLASQIEPGDYLPLTNFKAFDHTWLIELVWRLTSDAEVGLSTLSYRLKLTTPTPLARNLNTQYTLLRATFCEATFVKHICRFEFSPNQLNTPDCIFIADTKEKCIEIGREKVLYMRFCMSCN